MHTGAGFGAGYWIACKDTKTKEGDDTNIQIDFFVGSLKHALADL